MILTFSTNHTIQRLAVKVKLKSESYIRQGHPWIFESSVLKINKEGQAGDIAIIFDQKKNKYLGLGLYDPYSPIRIKLLAHTTKENINHDFFRRKIKEAFEIRKPLFETNTNAYRLIFGENDYLPGLIIDVYAHVAVIKLYSAIWIPYLHFILDIVIEEIGISVAVLRFSRLLQKPNIPTFGLEDGQVIYGDLKNPEIEFVEYGVRFIANVIKGHKTGYFLDHRANRKRVGEMSDAKRVLDVFSYAGGFSVHALAKGAKEVTSLDISKQALEVASENAKLNPYSGQHKIIAGDAFVEMKRLISEKKTYDIVVIDPPSFAKSTKEIEMAKKKYTELAKLGAQLTGKGGILVLASCSSRVSAEVFFEINKRALKTQNRLFSLEMKTYHDSDHPVTFPEGAYLKCAYYRFTN